MRVKKYKKVRRSKVHVELRQSLGEISSVNRDSITSLEELEGNGNSSDGGEMRVVVGPADTKKNNAFIDEKGVIRQKGVTEEEGAHIDGEENAINRPQRPCAVPDGSVQNYRQNCNIATFADTVPATEVIKDAGEPLDSPTPRTIACSDIESFGPSLNEEEGGEYETCVLSSSELGESYYHHKACEDVNNGIATLLGRGSLWFKVERILCFLQLLALTLDVDGAMWPSLFSVTWGWTRYAMECLRWPTFNLMHYVRHTFALTFGIIVQDLGTFRDIIGYGVEICAVGLATLVLFFVLRVSDYTSHKSQVEWKLRFLTHWLRLTLPQHIVTLCISYGSFACWMAFGSQLVSVDTVDAVTVIGVTMITVLWFSMLLFSLFVHLKTKLATKHDAEYSFTSAMKNLVKMKTRACLLFLHVAYVPVTASITRALFPVFDWNDVWTRGSRRAHNHHVWCYFLGFPPQVEGPVENIILECTSLRGVAMHTFSACALLLFTYGLPSLDRYLVHFMFAAFETNNDIIKSFVQAKEAHASAAAALQIFPMDVLWIARNRRELALAYGVVQRARRRTWRGIVTTMRRLPLIHRLSCLQSRRRRQRKPKNMGARVETRCRSGREEIDTGGNECGGEDVQREASDRNNIPGTKTGVCQDETAQGRAVGSIEWAADAIPPKSGGFVSSKTRKVFLKSSAVSEVMGVAQVRMSAPAMVPKGAWRETVPAKETRLVPTAVREYMRRRKTMCAGLQHTLATERVAYTNACGEYMLALSDFESDHSLEITCWESVVDTAGLLCLSESYTWFHQDWKAVECMERRLFVAGMLVFHQAGHAAVQLLLGAMVLVFFQTWTLKAEPFLRYREAFLDFGLRTALICVLFIGAAGSSGVLGPATMDTFLLGVGVVGILSTLYWADALGMIGALLINTIGAADNRVNDLLFRQVKRQHLGLENSHAGMRLLVQWDDLLEQQRWSAFLAWPSPTPANLLTTQEKLLAIRWAALRGIDIRSARTSMGLSLLHDAIIQGEVEAARWLAQLYPTLLERETSHKESPLLLGVLETARVLLKLETVQARIMVRDHPTCEGTVEEDRESIAPRNAGWAAGGTEGQLNEDQDEESQLLWKIGRLMELFLSPEIQHAELRWNAHRYGLLVEHGEADMAELTQHLAEAFNLRPPKGYAAAHRWRKRSRLTRDYLGEATCGSRTQLDCHERALGDAGYKTLLSICRALSSPTTTFSWPSAYITEFKCNVMRLDLSGNRLRRKSGYRVADMLLLNKTVTDLDLSRNTLDSQAASELFYAVRKSQVLRKLNLAKNKLGPEVSDSLAEMVTRNRSLVYLDLSDNNMGDKTFWRTRDRTSSDEHTLDYISTTLRLSCSFTYGDSTRSEYVHIPSAGPALGESLCFNRTLVVLNIRGNLLGTNAAKAFAAGVARHRSLTSLDLSGNLLLPDGGKTLALRLNFPTRSSLTSLNVSDNHLGSKAAMLFSATLKRNKNLRHLDLSHNELGSQAGIALAGALRVNSTLSFLSLAGNGMGAKSAKALAQGLAENSSLTAADLSHNAFGIATAEGGDSTNVGLILGQGLCSNATLTSLSLSGNRFASRELQRLFEVVGEHPSLARLDLAEETVNDAAARDIGRLVALGSLLTLDLRATALAGTGAAIITRAVSFARGLVRIDLSNNLLGPNATRELARSVSAEECAVRCLGIARCGLGNEAGTVIAKALGGNLSVEKLDISDNGLGEEAGLALATSLTALYRNGKEVRPCRMKRLDISLNALGNKAGVAILRSLVNDCTLYLDMSYTELHGGEAGRAIGRLLRCHTIALEHLNVEHNTLGRAGVNEVFWALRRNLSLLHLDISDNDAGPAFGTEADKLTDYGTTSINSALCLNQTLRFLDLGTNELSSECGITLTASLRKNRSLAIISLEHNLLDDDSALSIARKLRKDKQVEHLNLSHNRVRWRGGLDLAAALAINSHLTFLDVSNNKLGEGGTFVNVGAKFGDALVRNNTLTVLNLEGNTLGPAGGVAIAVALHRNNTLVDLNLRNNRFDQDVGFALEDLLKVNFTLNKLAASAEEIGSDCYANIADMLTAREKLFEAHMLSPLLSGSVSPVTPGKTYKKSQRGTNKPVGSKGTLSSDYRSDGSTGSFGTLERSREAQLSEKPHASARSLRARQVAMVAERKSSRLTSSMLRR